MEKYIILHAIKGKILKCKIIGKYYTKYTEEQNFIQYQCCKTAYLKLMKDFLQDKFSINISQYSKVNMNPFLKNGENYYKIINIIEFL